MPLFDAYHAYVFGTSLWYFLRGFMRIVSPETVVSWFRPPMDAALPANDLELYTTRTDALSLLLLSALLIVLSDALPLPQGLIGSTLSAHTTSPSSAPAAKTRAPYAKAMIVLTMAHHVLTGVGSWTHWRLATHRTVAMDVGVWGNVFFTVLGVAALRSRAWGEVEAEGGKAKGRKA